MQHMLPVVATVVGGVALSTYEQASNNVRVEIGPIGIESERRPDIVCAVSEVSSEPARRRRPLSATRRRSLLLEPGRSHVRSAPQIRH